VSSWAQVLTATARRRRAAMLAVALAMVPFVVVDFTLPPPGVLGLVGSAWTLHVLVGALLQHEAHPRWCAAGVLVATVASAACSVTMIALTGGTTSPLFALLMALAPCIALFFPELPGMALGSAMVAVAAGVAIRVGEGRDALDVGYWGALATAVAGLAVYAAALGRRQAERELALERDRRQALEALARAEVARLQLERLAEAGRLAASVAHDVNGPLSAARSNLAALGREPTLPEEERRAALRDALEAVQRVIETIGRLNTVMWREGRPAAPAASSPRPRDEEEGR
jgi:signal transduction histidine kinase